MRNLLIVLLMVVTKPTAAQTDTASKPAPHLCWRGKPAPACSTFWITEFGYDANLASTHSTVVNDFSGGLSQAQDLRDFESRVVWTIGPMFNTRPLRAVGATLSLGPVNHGNRAALEVRKRWWTPERAALDLSAGLTRMDVPRSNFQRERDYGVTGGVLLGGGDLININARADLLVTGAHPRVGASVGIGLGSYAAVGVMVVTAVLIAVVLSQAHFD